MQWSKKRNELIEGIMSRVRWVNIPIPPQHIVGLLLGTFLHITISHNLFSMSWADEVLGWPLIVTGIWISVKTVLEVGKMNIEMPTKLLITGPFTRSRNPMYVGWTLLYLGIAIAANSFWIIVLLPAIIVFTHLVDIRKEEQFLKAEFGDQYLEYQERVRRYF